MDVLVCACLYFVVATIFALGYRKVLEDVGDLIVRVLRLVCEVDPDTKMMVSIFFAFAALLWPAIVAIVIEQAVRRKNVDVHR